MSFRTPRAVRSTMSHVLVSDPYETNRDFYYPTPYEHPAPHLVFDVANRRLWADEEQVSVSETEFLILLWLAERAIQGQQMTDWSSESLANEFLALAGRVLNPMGNTYERIETAITERKAITIRCAEYFQPHKSRINKKLDLALGPRSAARYQIATSKNGETVTVFLPLSPEHITIESAPNTAPI